MYWLGAQYYAFGLGAASYLAGRRFSRPAKMKEYEAWLQGYVQEGNGLPGAQLPAEPKVSRKKYREPLGAITGRLHSSCFVGL